MSSIRLDTKSGKVEKHILSNGLTVLIVSDKTLPKVSIQLWYNVGSKDELTGEKGIAHLLEHMIFKGTNTLSESDINMITHKLSGSCNAFTSHDYTGYMFDFPSQNWQEALPILADCMKNCKFDPQMLSSELKAVIQELKMYKDDFPATLIENMLESMFPDHPYHYPIIGYKQDLWSLESSNLLNFYRKHYIPNNATLIVVGDIDTATVLADTQKYFANITANFNYKKNEFYHSPDIIKKDITIYRDVQTPTYMFAWAIPGIKTRQDYITDVWASIFSSGMGSRLYTKLVNKLEVATDIEAFIYDLFDSSIFFISVEPSENISKEDIATHIISEIEIILKEGLKEKEIQRAIRKIEFDYLSILESTQKQAYSLGKYYLALGDENYLYNYTNSSKENLSKQLHEFVSKYLRETIMYTGAILPLPKSESVFWQEAQIRSDLEDARILDGHIRTSDIEPGKLVNNINPKNPKTFNFPKAESTQLSNGIKVLYYNNPNMPKTELIIDFKAKHPYDPKNKDGLLNFMADMLLEGTDNYTADQLAQEIEYYGMSVTTAPGRIMMSMLSKDVKKGLEILQDIITKSSFTESGINKVRNQLIAEIKEYWDNPSQFIGQIARETIYKNHPYSKRIISTPEILKTITRQDLLDAYKKYITPEETTIVITGDLKDNSIKLLDQYLGQWTGPKVPDLEYPKLDPVQAQEINYPINRDQIVLAFAGLSVKRTDPDYDKLLLFDQILTGGISGSMGSKLFALREKSGLFYTIGGSIVANSDKQPGMIYIKTIVSPDRLSEAEESIKNVLDNAIDTITPEELNESKNIVINSLVDNFATNKYTAISILFLNNFKLNSDYFDKRTEQISNISLQEVKDAVKRYLNSKSLIKIRVGRV